jgi:hypothetical protein
MTCANTIHSRGSRQHLWTAHAAFMLPFRLIFSAAQSLAQTLTVLRNFTGGADGGGPIVGLTIDAAGNLYGTTTSRGPGGSVRSSR